MAKIKGGSLTPQEKPIVKALILQGERNQDIQALVNIGRSTTVNSARISEVKKNNKIAPSTPDSVELYKLKKQSYDHKTGLNLVDDERLIRAREAMMLAVQLYNTPNVIFKTEIFSILTNVAWTYLFHEYYTRKNVAIYNKNGDSLLISQILKRDDCPVSKAVKANILALKNIRDCVEHKILGRADHMWLNLYQTNCLNFNNTIKHIFGEKTGLDNELSFALHFNKIGLDQLGTLSNYNIPENLLSLCKNLNSSVDESIRNSTEYSLKVHFTMEAAANKNTSIKFSTINDENAKTHVLVKHKPADELYPYKPKQVCAEVTKATKTNFSSRNHTQAWKYFNVREKSGSKNIRTTNKEFCIFHIAHNDFTYSQEWIDKLIETVQDSEAFEKLKRQKC